jgi:hypothetical protein
MHQTCTGGIITLLGDRYLGKSSGKHKYWIQLDVFYKFHKENKEFSVYIENTRKPNIGDFLELFRKRLSIEMELISLNPCEFKPIELRTDGIVKIQVIKTFVDTTYR